MKFIALVLAVSLLGCASRKHHPQMMPIVFRNCQVVRATSTETDCRCSKAQWMRDAKTGGWVALCR